MKKYCYLFLYLLYLISCDGQKKRIQSENLLLQNKKVVIVHSYHATVGGVIKKNKNLLSILNKHKIKYEIIYLDTRRNINEEFRLNVAKKAYARILELSPDLVITFDDNAVKYLLKPYLKDSKIPVIFGGVDWDASVYGLPYKNTTGMVSVDLVQTLQSHLQSISKGSRVAWIGYRDLTSEKTITAYKDVLKLKFDPYFVKSNLEWEAQFIDIQNRYDLLILSGSLPNMEDWDLELAKKFVKKNIKIPIGTVNSSVLDLSVILLSNDENELSNWISEATLKILQGESISEIKMTTNKNGDIYLNFDLAEILDISFPSLLLKNMKQWNP